MNGNDILKMGFPRGPAVGKAIAVAFRVLSEHPAYPDDMQAATGAARGVLVNVLNDPSSVGEDAPADLFPPTLPKSLGLGRGSHSALVIHFRQ